MSVFEDVRQTVISKVEELRQTWTEYDLVIEYQNMNQVNMSLQRHPFLRVSIFYHDGRQVDLAREPIHRFVGSILLEAMAKEGTGMSKANDLLAHFYPHIHMTDNLTPVRTRAGIPSYLPPKAGWVAQTMSIPFTIDDK